MLLSLNQKLEYRGVGSMKAFNFILPDRVETIDSMSFKKAVKSFQNKYPDLKEVMIKYINKKKHKIMRLVKLPIGRKKKIGS